MRRYISLALGIAICGGGLWWAYDLYFLANRPHRLLIIGAMFLAGIGAVLVWENWRAKNDDD